MTFPITEGIPMNTEPHMIGDTYSGALPQRKKLQLKPRSVRSEERARRRSTSAKGDPFGNAVPREEVLKNRGVDVKTVDSRIEKKAEKPSFTPDQEIQVEAIRAQLTKAEALLRDANEKELPEEVFRVQVEAKRKELSDIMEKFAKLNVNKGEGLANKDPWSPPDKDRRRSPRSGNNSNNMSPKMTGANRRNWNEVN